ncbi:MAG: 4-hydroxy-tetrahydrodipicolinate reductase [Opitutales bacterium]
MSLKVILSGAQGRMGRTLAGLASECEAEVVGELEMGDPLDQLPWNEAQAVIDFSFHGATLDLLRAAEAARVPVVIGTTGHTSEELAGIREIAERLPVSLAGNYSIGVNLLMHLVGEAARILPGSYAPEITEIHHRHKKDAPSGTAINLAEVVEGARDFPDGARVYGRKGDTGERRQTEIAVHALRGGGDSDRIELTHRAADRGIFARGAYQAAHWLARREPGLYSMRDVLGLR